jgi:hypothetical protein
MTARPGAGAATDEPMTAATDDIGAVVSLDDRVDVFTIHADKMDAPSDEQPIGLERRGLTHADPPRDHNGRARPLKGAALA